MFSWQQLSSEQVLLSSILKHLALPIWPQEGTMDWRRRSFKLEEILEHPLDLC